MSIFNGTCIIHIPNKKTPILYLPFGVSFYNDIIIFIISEINAAKASFFLIVIAATRMLVPSSAACVVIYRIKTTPDLPLPGHVRYHCSSSNPSPNLIGSSRSPFHNDDEPP